MQRNLLADLDPGLRTDLDSFLLDWLDARCQPASPKDIAPEPEIKRRELVGWAKPA